MRRLWISLALILLMAAAAGWHVRHLNRFTSSLTGLLHETAAALAEGDWDAAQARTQEAFQRWEGEGPYLHTTLRHAEVDAILTAFEELSAYLDSRENTAAASAVTARLITQLELLAEAEAPLLTNIL